MTELGSGYVLLHHTSASDCAATEETMIHAGGDEVEDGTQTLVMAEGHCHVNGMHVPVTSHLVGPATT